MTSVGCCGYPVSRSAYHAAFLTVEIGSAFYALPRLSTVQRWRDEAPEGFVFALKAWQPVTHPHTSPTYRRLRPAMDRNALARCGHFKPTDEVRSAWERTLEVSEALGARFVLFQTPASFYPGSNHLRDMYAFFKRARRGEASFVWETRGGWEDRLVRRVCSDLGLIHGLDPLRGAPQHGSVRYYRLQGRVEGRRIVYGHDYSDAELRELLERCRGREAYVYFNNTEMWRDARRFRDLTATTDI